MQTLQGPRGTDGKAAFVQPASCPGGLCRSRGLRLLCLALCLPLYFVFPSLPDEVLALGLLHRVHIHWDRIPCASMADAWTIVGLILGIIGALLIGQNIWDIIHNRLPKTRLRELEQLLEETGFMLQEGLDDGLLYHPSFLHSIDRRLLRCVLWRC